MRTRALALARSPGRRAHPAARAPCRFRKGDDGKFIWPGFGENSRVLEWVFNRCSANAEAVPTVETPIGYVPDWKNGGLSLEGLDLPASTMEELFRVDLATWRGELDNHKEIHDAFGGRLPQGIIDQRNLLADRLA